MTSPSPLDTGDPRPAAPQTEPDLVTVVIPARNEERAIEECVASVLRQDYRNLQVVVVDGASTDRTAEIVLAMAERDPRVELLHNPRVIIPVSLNVALAAARAPWLVRIDAHATVPPDYVRLAVEQLRTGRWGGVGGRKDGVGRTAAGRAVAAAMSSRFGVGNSTYHYGTAQQTVEHIPFGAYPVALARQLGGWDEALRVNQDFEFDYRVRLSGRELLFDPALVIEWESRQSIRELFSQYRRYGKGKLRVGALHPGSLRTRHFAAPALVASWAAAAALAPRCPAATAAVVAPYVLGVAAASVATAKPLDPAARRYVPAAFVAMHAGWGLGFWEGVAELARGGIRWSGPAR